ncbi:uncharacterized protein LOC110689444 [Chenopodium quinoa]|uniref:uncharacterized protein LOC110689444 n=1 Tax=Chenopodium quinoa TaxID=63459 RepID=UPI000B794ECB|nr:uncharacterized protein LOC110689444 [Chenopodium quinoa]
MTSFERVSLLLLTPARDLRGGGIQRGPARDVVALRQGVEAARADVAEGSGSSSEGAHAAPVGEATSVFRGGGMYEVGSSSQQPPRPQPQVDPGWSGPILSLPPPTETGAGAGGEVTPRTVQFYDMMGLRMGT